MSITLNGTTGITTPSLVADTDTLYVDATNDKLGVGTTSPTQKLTVSASSNDVASIISTGDTNADLYLKASGTTLGNVRLRANGNDMVFIAGLAERARIDSSGNLLVGTSNTSWTSNGGAGFVRESNNRSTLICATNSTSGLALAAFINPNGTVGTIQTSGTSTSYVTSSDYRLKENIAPMTGALDKVSALKPVTYTWKADGSDGQGFIAHELQAVVPDCVTGEKDAVDADGNPVYQGIDTSFLVATLTAAIQELKAELDTVKTELATLKGTV